MEFDSRKLIKDLLRARSTHFFESRNLIGENEEFINVLIIHVQQSLFELLCFQNADYWNLRSLHHELVISQPTRLVYQRSRINYAARFKVHMSIKFFHLFLNFLHLLGPYLFKFGQNDILVIPWLQGQVIPSNQRLMQNLGLKFGTRVRCEFTDELRFDELELQGLVLRVIGLLLIGQIPQFVILVYMILLVLQMSYQAAVFSHRAVLVCRFRFVEGELGAEEARGQDESPWSHLFGARHGLRRVRQAEIGFLERDVTLLTWSFDVAFYCCFFFWLFL